MTTKSKEAVINNGICWLHSKKEVKDQTVLSPHLAVATKKRLSFYEVSLKSAGLVAFAPPLHSRSRP